MGTTETFSTSETANDRAVGPSGNVFITDPARWAGLGKSPDLRPDVKFPSENMWVTTRALPQAMVTDGLRPNGNSATSKLARSG